jgi:MerR family copper efflux transcriptional regulator
MDHDTMRIGEAAAQAGVSIQTLRYYERRGIITKPARRPSGYREYSPDVVRLIRLIKWAQNLGFTLDEIKEMTGLIQNQVRGGAVRARAAAKIRDVDEKIHRLQTMRAALEALADCSCNGKCPIIRAALDGDAAGSHKLSAP